MTVTCPCDVVNVKVSPLKDAMVPFAPRRWNWEDCVVSVDGEVVVVVVVTDGCPVEVVCGDADAQAVVTINRETAVAMPVPIGIMFLRFIFI